MRSILLAGAALLWLGGPGLAAGWRVIVDDSSGDRSVVLRGDIESNPEHGVVVLCSKEVTPVMVFSAGRSGDFGPVPGERSVITAGAKTISMSVIRQNDSSGTVAWGEIVDLHGLLDVLAAEPDPMEVRLLALDSPKDPLGTIEIPRDSLDSSIVEFRKACNL